MTQAEGYAGSFARREPGYTLRFAQWVEARALGTRNSGRTASRAAGQ